MAEAAGEPGEPAPGRVRRRPARDEDRYRSLLDSLRTTGGAAGDRGPTAGAPGRAAWHPVALRLVLAFAVVVAVYLAFVAVAAFLREGRVDTWAGPDATVRSGQRLAGCPEAEHVRHETFPSWILYDGVVYALTEAILPVAAETVGAETVEAEASYTDTGYTLEGKRLLLDELTQAGRARDRIIVVLPPALAGHLYLRTDCAPPS